MRRDEPRVLLLGGTLVAGADGTVAPGGPLVKAMLAVLALEAGRPIGIDRLSDLLWGDDPPDGVRSALQQTASRVRRGLRPAGLDGALRAVGPTYVLDVEPGAVDVLRFRQLMRQATDASRRGDAGRGAELATMALTLWRGPCLADLVDLPVSRLSPLIDDERWRAEEIRAQCLVASGAPDEAATRLSAAVSLEPLRERLWVLLAEALIAGGRADEAVAAVRTGADVIAARLGAPPSPALLQLEHTARVAPVQVHAHTPASGAMHAEPHRRNLLDEALMRAIDNQVVAARSASERRAHAEAAHRWQRVLDLLGDQPRLPDDYRWRTTALLGIGDAHNEAGAEHEARQAFGRAATLAREHGDSVTLAKATLGYCSDRVRVAPLPEHRAMLDEALEALGDADITLRARLLTRRATERYWVGPIEEVRGLAEEGFATALASGNAEARLWAWQGRAYSVWTPYTTEALLVVCRAYLDDAVVTGNRFHEQLARRWLVHPLDELGRLDAARQQIMHAIELADDLGASNQQWVSRILLAGHLMLSGDLVAAEAAANDALAIGAASEPETSLDYVSIFLWTLRWMQGRLAEVAPLVEEVAAAPGVGITRRMALAGTHALLGRHEAADAILDEVTPAALGDTHLDSSWYIAMASAAEAIGQTGHRGAAAVVRRLLEPISGQFARTSPAAMGPIDNQLAICAWALGDRTQAVDWFQAAIELCDRCGAGAFGARTRIELAGRLDGIGEREQARRLAVVALPVAEEAGMAEVARQAAELLAGRSIR